MPMGPEAGGMPPPMMPKNPAGGPGGPGSSPALSPGGGAGAQGAARAQMLMMLDAMYLLLGSFPRDSKEFGSVMRAIESLRSTFGKSGKSADITPAGVQQMVNQTKEGKPFAATQPAGMQAGPPKMPGAPPGMPPGAMPGMPGG